MESRSDTVLVVDDEPRNLKLVRAFLQSAGYCVEEASNGNEALKTAQIKTDLILLDIMMPGMDGFDTCRMLKKSDATKEIPVIFLSALQDPTIIAAGFEAGGVDYVTKPFDEHELLARVNTHLTIRRQALEIKRYATGLEELVTIRTADLIQANERLHQEIEERKRAEQSLRESEEMYRLHFENVSDAIYMIDSKLKFVSVSPSVEKHWGYKPTELIGRSFSELGIFAPNYVSTAFRDVRRVLSGEAISSIYELVVRDGTRKFSEIHATPLKRDGRVVAVIGVGRDITERKLAEEQLRASLEEKKILLKEIHHRVKNNLQIISSLLNLQAGKVNNLQAKEILRDSHNRIRSIALLHERLYRSESLSRIDYSEYLTNLTTHILRAHNIHGDAVKLRVNADDVSLNPQTAIACGLIVNELVTNSLKHAFPKREGCEICVEINSQRKDRYVLIVKDNGVGIPKNLDLNRIESLGIQLITNLTNQLGGTIELDRKHGTTFRISFPAN